MSELNPRQWALYNYLKERGDQWTPQVYCAAYICQDAVHQGIEPPYYGDWNGNPKEFHDSPARLQMTADIRAINESTVIQKVIIASPKGIKIANSEEFDRYIRKEIMAAVRRLMRAKYKAQKGSRDGQMRFVFGSERDTIKAFIDSDKAIGERLRDARIKAGLKAVDVVKLLNIKSVDAPMLSRFEKGYCAPNSTTLFRLAEIYGVQPYYFTMGEEHAPAANVQN